jgi:hypothetical protein
MSCVSDFVLRCARLAAPTGEELAALRALSSFSRSRMHYSGAYPRNKRDELLGRHFAGRKESSPDLSR